ncbi:MAG: carboxylesterase family protein [Tannerellaceae bacterium]|nr:carboxylesterase family protein [Tannerellaceae bacterium]
MRKMTTLLLSGLCAGIISYGTAMAEENDALTFNPSPDAPEHTMTFPDGSTVTYRAYENLYYVTDVVDSVYQSLNVYVPEVAYTNNDQTPVFLKTHVGGYMAAKATQPSPTDASGRALAEGYVVVIPGSRGANSKITTASGEEVFTGRAPNGLVDLKAAIRYLRYNKGRIPGDMEKIITDGTSAGGAMSSLLGATGNHPVYEPYLDTLGAAKERDDIFAAVCYCPITDLEHADMAYEWLYNVTNATTRGLTPEQIRISDELAALYPVYLNSLGLKKPDGTLLTDANYTDYLKSFLIRSAQRAKNAGADMPENAGITMNTGFRGSPGEFVVDIDLETYLNYVVTTQPLKTPPAFDALDVLAPKATPENNVFGDETGSSVNFTDFSLRKATKDFSATIDPALQERVYSMNPMYFIGNEKSTTTPNWYIRHGARDRDTGFQVSVNLYTRLINQGYNVNFDLAWNRGHMGDYNLDDLFSWIRKVVVQEGN